MDIIEENRNRAVESNNFQDNNSFRSDISVESQYVNALDTLAELADNSGVTPTEAIVKFIHDLDQKFGKLIQIGQAETVATMNGEPLTEDRKVMFDYIDEALDTVLELRDQALEILRRLDDRGRPWNWFEFCDHIVPL